MPGFELIDEKEKLAICELFDDGGVLFAHGFDGMRKGRFHVREFESEVAEYFQAKYALAVSSGTAALKVALKGLGVKPGDEVITQAFTFVATVEAIIEVGATPVVVNVDDTLNMDVLELERAINEKTKAIIPVHMLGVAANMEKICEIAESYSLKVLEDNCEAFGARYKDQFLGTFGDIGVVSFDHGKALTTGEGGMLLTDDYELYCLMKEYHDHGHENNPSLPRGRDSKRISGFNYRMTEMQAAIGKVQLGKIDQLFALNSERYDLLDKVLAPYIIKRQLPDDHIGQKDCFIFKIESSELKESIVNKLGELKIGTKNLPDAMEWHCAYYWEHMIGLSDRDKLRGSVELLEKYIAIPIAVSTPVDRYLTVARELVTLIESSLD